MTHMTHVTAADRVSALHDAAGVARAASLYLQGFATFYRDLLHNPEWGRPTPGDPAANGWSRGDVLSVSTWECGPEEVRVQLVGLDGVAREFRMRRFSGCWRHEA